VGSRPAVFILVAAICGSLAACGPQTDLGGTPIPNEPPDTRVTARPPDLDETACTVAFSWIGYDPDGYVRGYEWRISDNGDDGISVQDTLTRDPVTGAPLHPWHAITSGDSVFVVSAARDSFPGEPARVRRAWESHTFYVRALDETGLPDPSPASVNFTATTLSPSGEVALPMSAGNEPFQMAPAVAFMYGGVDPDFVTGIPTQVRYLWKPAIMPDGQMADTHLEVMAHLDYFASFTDSAWSAWQPFAAVASERRISLGQLPARDPQGQPIYYVFCVQTQDTSGAVSIERTYGAGLRHFWITPRWPTLTIAEPNLGQSIALGTSYVLSADVAPNQSLSFSWGATADSYVGRVVSYRYGWDVVDVENPQDPGWAVAAGNTLAHRRAPTRSFLSGVHTLVVEATDDSGQLTRARFALNVVPLRDPQDQYPCLLIDDVFDRHSNAWPGQSGLPLDNDQYRDAFWLNALGGPGGVQGFLASRDVLDTEVETPDFRAAAQYRAVVVISRWVARPNNYVSRAFRATTYTSDPYNWLASYQAFAGNVFYCAQRAMDNFLQQITGGYALPIVFQSTEGDANGLEGTYRVGFGTRTLPDDTVIQVGPTRYPYATWGIAVVDQMSPASSYPLYGVTPTVTVAEARKSTCAGMKRLVLDQDFRQRHLPGGLAFPETIGVDTQIDWRDQQASYYNNLNVTYAWGNDEFYDQVIVDRITPWSQQACAEGPQGHCVEPMLRAQARFDWIRQQHLAANPQDPWPVGYYNPPMSRYCGRYGLEAGRWSAVTNNTVVGVVSYQNVTRKPSGRGDVAWGFDPYRFNHAGMTEAVRWVLTGYFGLPARP
jgi:RimJ/RimL family protein N-acetyltransferase